jgi:hypothetical protein
MATLTSDPTPAAESAGGFQKQAANLPVDSNLQICNFLATESSFANLQSLQICFDRWPRLPGAFKKNW